MLHIDIQSLGYVGSWGLGVWASRPHPAASSRDFTLCKSVRPTGVLAAYKAPRFSADLRQAFSAAKSPCGLRTYIK